MNSTSLPFWGHDRFWRFRVERCIAPDSEELSGNGFMSDSLPSTPVTDGTFTGVPVLRFRTTRGGSFQASNRKTASD